MKMKAVNRAGAVAFVIFLASICAHAQFSVPGAAQPGSAFSIPQAQVIQLEALIQMMHKAGPVKPLVLQVGSHLMFAEAHIPGSEYAGPGSRPEGLQMLQQRVDALSRKTTIVLYCGCCPWGRCPNVEPAFAKLQQMGFTDVKVLYLADNFGDDWVAKGYPVEQGR
jgi:hypothetical protein